MMILPERLGIIRGIDVCVISRICKCSALGQLNNALDCGRRYRKTGIGQDGGGGGAEDGRLRRDGRRDGRTKDRKDKTGQADETPRDEYKTDEGEGTEGNI